MNRFLRRTLLVIFAAAAALLAAVGFGAEFLTDFLWFKTLGYASVFWTILAARWAIYLVFGLLAAGFIYANLTLTRQAVVRAGARYAEQFPPLAGGLRWLKWIFLGVSVFFGLSSAGAVSGYWDVVLKYFNRVPFGITDPVFKIDVGYFVFQLPFLQLLYSLLTGLLGFSLLVTAVIYLFSGSLRFERIRLVGTSRARIHVTVLLAALFTLKAWGYLLSMHQLVYSPRGVVFGASYTDVHVGIPVFKVLSAIAVFAALLLLVNIFRHSERLVIGSVLLLGVSSLVLGSVVPDLFRRFVVEPNELEKERPYIEYNVAMTRRGFGIDRVQERFFDTGQAAGAAELLSRPETLENIRLWDWRPLRDTYRQLQEIRPYYEFNHVDVDRYVIDGRLRQVMLAARELAIEDLPNKTWINEHMQYTHGYGIVMSPVDTATPEGLPNFLISNIPPRSTVGLEVTRPELYYGEKTDQYVIVKTDMPEFDYPKGEKNAFTTYQGRGGVEMSSPLTRVAFALRFSNIKFLLANDINPTSRVMFYRNIHQRVRRIAPFLKYDADPYIVLSEGRLFWIQDAYTVSNQFPFSELFREWGNYVRNSVKIVIDAYHGDVTYYIADEADPLIAVYRNIFPALFKPISEMPEDLRSHIHYPVDLFNVQARVYSVYHMDDPTVFYNREDQWNIPEEIVAGERVRMEPYYVVMRLQEGTKTEMILMLPFTPARKENMVAWMAARNDVPHYGELLVYKFPKQSLTYGPMQLEAQIDQDAEISQLLTLWNQKGSRVNRGNTLVIPLERSLLYIEPIYLQAEQSQMPQLKRVIAAYGEEELIVVMEPTLQEALSKLVKGVTLPTRDRGPEREIPVEDLDIAALIKAAADKYEEAKEQLKKGDWAGYGRRLEEFEALLRELEKSAL